MPNYNVTIHNASNTNQDWASPSGNHNLVAGAQHAAGMHNFNADVNFAINVTQANGNFAGVTLRYRIATDTWSLWPAGLPFTLVVAGQVVTLSCANIPAAAAIAEPARVGQIFDELIE